MNAPTSGSPDEVPIAHATILIKGAGEKASAVAHRLYQAGLRRIVMTEQPHPIAERRGVTFSEALIDGKKEVDGVTARKIPLDPQAVERAWDSGSIGVMVDPEARIRRLLNPTIIIDAIMAKRNTGSSTDDAPLVIALGPGFLAGRDAHYVVETNPNTDALGIVIANGSADENTGLPTPVLGLRKERLILATADGVLTSGLPIGASVRDGDTIGYIGECPIRARMAGVVWGLVRDGVSVKKGQKIGDIDPRGDRSVCFKITPQARAISCGVLESIFRFFLQCETETARRPRAACRSAA